MIVVTAGHVDHGKSTLVRLITGTDPDRLDEEKRRGLTIELGFAFADLPSGRRLAFVDVPGHDRFVRTMLAGCAVPDAAALLTISAVEGWMPQTEEHVEIIRFSGITRGVIALTHRDRVDDDRLRAAADEVRSRLAATSLASAKIIPTASSDSDSIRSLLLALDELGTGETSSLDQVRPRMWIDRSFLTRGHGRVVTGTLVGGPVTTGDRIDVVHGTTVAQSRIRSVRSNGTEVHTAMPGTRVAINLAGRVTAERGAALVNHDQWATADTLLTSFNTVRSLRERPSPRRSYRIFIGTTATGARLKYLDDGTVRFRLDRTLSPIAIGDRYVLRDETDQHTVGGGTITGIGDTPTATAHPQPPTVALVPMAASPPADIESLVEIAVAIVMASSSPFVTAAELRSRGLGGNDRQRLLLAGHLVEVGDFYLLSTDFSHFIGQVERRLSGSGAATVSELRETTALSRKYLLPLLECMDRRGHTQRVGDCRMLGAPSHDRSRQGP